MVSCFRKMTYFTRRADSFNMFTRENIKQSVHTCEIYLISNGEPLNSLYLLSRAVRRYVGNLAQKLSKEVILILFQVSKSYVSLN